MLLKNSIVFLFINFYFYFQWKKKIIILKIQSYFDSIEKKKSTILNIQLINFHFPFE